ncbi:MAG TPA: tetratricopeptide repeat protein [Micropepsaceae bacterium]|nr:tetratricopeptide repeat protein [Micropepsaceae bacterium]
MATRITILMAAALMLFGSQARAEALEDGIAAAKAGDPTKAAGLWAPLASHGTGQEQLRIAQVYFLGPFGEAPNMPKDDAEAAKWFLLAAKQDVAEAQEYVGVMYAEGHGLTRDRVRAYLWLSLSGDNLNRDKVASTMTTLEITRAQELAMQCKAPKFENCD